MPPRLTWESGLPGGDTDLGIKERIKCAVSFCVCILAKVRALWFKGVVEITISWLASGFWARQSTINCKKRLPTLLNAWQKANR